MPICKKPPPTMNHTKSATDFDDHAPEAAKVKRTREQAYFNSYNFDAIDVLPHNKAELPADEDSPARELAATSATVAKVTTNAGSGNQHNALTSIYHKNAASSLTSSQSCCSSRSRSSTAGSSERNNTDGYLRRQHSGEITYAYRHRLGALLARSCNASPSSDVGRSSTAGGGGAIAAVASEEITPVHAMGAADVPENGSFLLPRAMLKYQSVNNANSLPLAAATSGHADKLLQTGHNHQPYNDSNNNHNTDSSSSSNSSNYNNNSASYNKYNNSICSGSSGCKSVMMTNNANSNKHNNNNSKSNVSNNATNTIINNNNNVSSSSSSNSSSNNNNNNNNNNANTTVINNNNNNGKNNKNKQNYANSKDGYASLLVTSGANSAPFRATTATQAAVPTTPSAAGAVVRVKKQSTSSTITTTSASSECAERGTRGNDRDVAAKPTDTKLTQSGGSERRGRTNSHQSHYSTDKSGSSGYYSSNVCSTYSLEEHIYCEPVIDILDVSGVKSKSARLERPTTNGGDIIAAPETTLTNSRVRDMSSTGGAAKHFARRTGTAASGHGESGITANIGVNDEEDCDGDAENDVAAHTDNSRNSRKGVPETTLRAAVKPLGLQFILQRQACSEYPPSQHFADNLRILESSIENLDRHLKNCPSLSSHERIATFVQSHHNTYLQQPSFESGEKLTTRVPYHPHHNLPTIMEGYDPANQPRHSWPDDIVDDSLLDIDLDSFLLVNESKTDGNVGGKTGNPLTRGSGIDNPTFLIDEREEENNYKCAKYINSCPDDAYRVESDIVAGTGPASENSVSVVDHYVKRYEDQLHFQNTRELLEDVRDKIRLLSKASSGTHSPDSQISRTPTEHLPRELEDMIKALKNELENYLNRMNQHSELEIRQLCSGLVKNHNIMRMKNAFERRRSSHSLDTAESTYGYASNYEAICNGVPVSIRNQIASIRCASDPNFKMKRKSLAEVFPMADCYTESEALQRVSMEMQQQQQHRASLSRLYGEREHEQNVISSHSPATQLHRNLSFQQPILNKLDAKTLPTTTPDGEGGKVSPNGNHAGGNGSGAESGESGDKDSILEWHRKKPSIWEMYYGTNRMNQSLLGKRNSMVTNNNNQVTMSYPSSRPESDFTLDLPRAEQLRIKMEKEKKFRQRCRYITTFLSLVFFLLTVMVVSLVLTRGKRMFGSMI